MKPAAVCMLLVRVLGLLLVLWRAEAMVMYLVLWAKWFGLALSDGPSGLWYSFWMDAYDKRYYLPSLVIIGQFSLGLYMLFGGKRVVRFLLRSLPGVSGHCSHCGYDISGLEGGRCPECGAKVPASSPERP